MKMNVTATVSHALGHWPRILPALGIQVLKNRHQPCPVCGGSDRFRFDDREGRGTWYCNQCGAGDGLKLVEKVFGVSPSDAAAKVAAVTGSLPPADPAVTAAAGAETDAARKNAAALAQTLMAKTCPGTGNAYLTRKGFPGRECRMLTGTHRAGGVSWRAGDLVVPLYDDSGELVNLQLISADGRKRTLKGGQVRGTCHTFEGQNQAGKRLWIAEGYATALTVHHLTGETVMVALSSVNLLSLASLARQKYPACQIVLAADRDLSGDGQTKAAAAADACEGVVALPPVFGDWNDAFTQYGGEANATSATIETLESPRERAALTGFSLIRLPDQEKWSGDGAGLKAITGGDAVSVDPKYRDAYSTHIPAVILAVNNNPMRFTDRSGGVSRRRVIIHFPEQIAPQERDPQLKDKITRELAVIVRHLMQKFSDPMLARSLLQSQQNSDEALNIKRDADPTFDFIGYLETLPQTSGMYMGNASIIPRNYRKYLYHAYLAYMEANGYRNVLSLKMFGLGLPVMLKEYGLNYEKRHTKQGIQTNLTLKEESYGDWLPKCDDPATT
ncbi:TPA: hypothetical protein JV381_003808 [Escherichia coli]|uniref:primase-helicase zinc-binding domain-containing protein n=1 Tax=Escherichia coli TaxID=562 RepID=UPI001CD71BDA|nr:primase-helicase zinc-binding domain-containing protein [Escherichia coli]HAX3809368.1 hypothetical protein [Escherichia coli]